MTDETYDRDYYLNGKATGKSNYEGYKWLPELTKPACAKIAEYLGIAQGESILDIGAARGYYVKAFRQLGYRAYGYDISRWAVENADPEAKPYMSNELPDRAFDWAICKDVCEHVPLPELRDLLTRMNRTLTKGLFVIVPLTQEVDGGYVREEDEHDPSHVIRWPLWQWMDFLEAHAPNFNLNASFHIHGIKPASAEVKHSCGFLTLMRP